MIAKAIRNLFAAWGHILCRFRQQRFIGALGAYNDAFRKRFENVNFNPESNGEWRVLRLLADMQPQCAFDVGAHTGDWSRALARLYPQCRIHAFEIVPSTYNQLLKSISGWPTISANNYGLSDQPGEVEIYYSDTEMSTATAHPISGMKQHDEFYSKHLPGIVKTASDYITEQQIKVIDFVKIDVEGMDFQVLKGFGDQLNRVRVIQFEYGIFNIASRALLYDFYRYLDAGGFVLGKIYPRFVEFFEYHFDRENFLGNNYLAVRRDETELLKSLSGGRAGGK